MPELITDRSGENVFLLQTLLKKGWSKLSAYEKSLWQTTAAKGAYNYTDLNRVEAAVAELAERLGLKLSTKTDWSLWDVPVEAEMERYLANVIAVRDASGGRGFPSLPESMSRLNYESANNIEKTLEMVYELVGNTSNELGMFVLGESALGDKK